MIKNIKLLAAAFAAQLIIVCVFWLSSANQANTSSKGPLLTNNITDVDTIEIQGTDSSTLLKKVENGWILPNYGQLETSENKADALVQSLADLSAAWPVATTNAAAQRFEVSESNAQTRITLSKDGKVVHRLYLGTSPSFRKVHARVDDSENIYSVTFSQFDAPSKESEWFNKSLLQFSGELKSVKTNHFQLSKQSEIWSVSPLAEQDESNSEEINTWVEKLKRLNVKALVPQSDAQKIIVQDPILTVNLAADNGASTDFAFYKTEDAVYVKQFGKERVFEIANYIAEPLVEVNLNNFIRKPVEESIVEGEEKQQNNGA